MNLSGCFSHKAGCPCPFCGNATGRGYTPKPTDKRRGRAFGYERAGTAKAAAPLTIKDLHWAAGFLEGEGTFFAVPRKGRANAVPSECVTAPQVQREPLERLQRILGGNITSLSRPYTDGKGVSHRAIQKWAVYGGRARGVMLTLFPLMSPARKDQIRRAMLGITGRTKDAA